MSKLYFYFGTMNAGKSVNLIKDAHNYEELGRSVIVIKPQLDSRGEAGKISCRIEGMNREAILFDENENLFDKLRYLIEEAWDNDEWLGAVFVDEAQFLTRKQAFELSHVPDYMDTPVLAYGLRTDAFGNAFEGSLALFELADSLKEIKTMCNYSDKKATMVLRFDDNGKVVTSGDTIQIGGNDHYKACSRKAYKRIMYDIHDERDL